MVDSRSTQPIGSVFVGRQREMAELTAALDDALSGHGRVVMLVGEPGIGKTRTTQELASDAENRGALVLWGRCFGDEGTPPYWPWVQTMRSYVQHSSVEQIVAETGSGAADIAELIPNLRDKLPDLEPPQALEPDAARFRLFDSVTTFLKNVAQSQPLMLVLDDLHWADRSSLLLLEFLTRELGDTRILLVGCYRDTELSRQHPLSEALAQLSREPVFRRQVLRGLGLDELGQFIEATTGVQLSQELTGTLYAHTEGNPFFMTEVIRLLSESGGVTASHTNTPGGLRIPQGVREVIGQRLNRLSEQCNEVLTTASIIGREFDFRLLNILDDEMSEGQLLAAVDEAVSSHLIEDVPGYLERYQFSHALVQQTLAEEVTTSRMVRLHARIGEALEALYADDVKVHAAELAHHFAEAQTTTGTEKLVRYSLLAGERALLIYAYEDALAHFERGLVARDISLSGTEAASDEAAADLLFGLARAQAATLQRHQLGEAAINLHQAFDYYAEAGKVDQAVDIAAYWLRGLGPPSRTIGEQIIARTLELVPPDSHEAGRLLSGFGRIKGTEKGGYESGREALGRALVIAQSTGDVGLEIRTLAAAAAVEAYHNHWHQALEEVLRAIDLTRYGDTLEIEANSYHWTSLSWLATGDLEGARQHSAEMLKVAAELHGNYQLATALWRNEKVASVAGDWQAARGFSDRASAIWSTDPRFRSTRMRLEYETGEYDHGEGHLEQLMELIRNTPPGPSMEYVCSAAGIPIIARITGMGDRVDVAQTAAESVIASSSGPPLYAAHARAGLALLAALRGDVAVAAEQYDHLEPLRGTLLVFSLLAIDRVLGILAHSVGNLDQAIVHFGDGLAFCRKAGYRPELAWTCCDYSDVLVQRNGPQDRTNAMALLEESLAISTELGMPPLMERVTERLERAEAQPETSPAYPGGLTQREVEVLRLVAAGKSNADIAEELVISPNTVVRHVSNILAKTGSSNRTEAAAFATRNDLV